MRKLVVVMLVVFAAISLAGAAPAQAQASGPVEMEREFVALLNDLRASQGLPGLAIHDELVAKARRWSATMAAEGRIWHSDLRDGITVSWRRLGENVGRGGSVRALHDAFVASPSHYENLIDPGFNYVAVGVVVDADGTIFVSQEFMELAPAPPPVASLPAPSAPQAGATRGANEPGTAVSFEPTDPKPAPVPTHVRGNIGRAAPATPSPSQPQEDGSTDQATGAVASDDGTRAATLQPVFSTTPTQLLALGAVILLAGIAFGLRVVAAGRVTRAADGR